MIASVDRVVFIELASTDYSILIEAILKAYANGWIIEEPGAGSIPHGREVGFSARHRADQMAAAVDLSPADVDGGQRL